MSDWVKRWFLEIIPTYVFLSKPHIAYALLRSKDNTDDVESALAQQHHHIRKLSSYLKVQAIEKYPPIIQQAIRDIRYISERQREDQRHNLVCSKNKIRIR